MFVCGKIYDSIEGMVNIGCIVFVYKCVRFLGLNCKRILLFYRYLLYLE